MTRNIDPAYDYIKKRSVGSKNILTITVKPADVYDRNEKCTPVIIVLYLPVFTSASRPKKGKESR